jgi:two-component system alkaline phosphatase synthesis response regulator PhoP
MSRILVVDDEPDILCLVRITLERSGHEVITALNYTECFERLNEVSPDLILMDVLLPDVDGWEACRRIKREDSTKDIPVIIFTVEEAEEAVKKSYEYALCDFHLCKPYSTEDLMKVVNSLLYHGTIKDLTKQEHIIG